MNNRTLSWTSLLYYMLGLVGTQLFVISLTVDANFWVLILLRVPFWAFVYILSVRLFGRRRADES